MSYLFIYLFIHFSCMSSFISSFIYLFIHLLLLSFLLLIICSHYIWCFRAYHFQVCNFWGLLDFHPPGCADLMFEMLVDFSNFLRRNNVTFMLSEGTLLGAVRDQDRSLGCPQWGIPGQCGVCQDIIPYTADLDIFVPREGGKLQNFRRRVCAIWFTIDETWELLSEKTVGSSFLEPRSALCSTSWPISKAGRKPCSLMRCPGVFLWLRRGTVPGGHTGPFPTLRVWQEPPGSKSYHFMVAGNSVEMVASIQASPQTYGKI